MICIINKEGKVAITRPPNEVKSKEIAINLPGKYRSANEPPKM